MRITTRWTIATFLIGLAVTASADSGKKYEVTDDCAPNADWGVLGGCLRDSGEVTRAEFNEALANGYPGHPAWRIVEPYADGQLQSNIRVENTGGRDHSFTEVARFGGGFVPPLNPAGAALAPECAIVNNDGSLRPSASALATMIAPGGDLRVDGLEPGTHNFQCCIHPWMRTTVKVRSTEPDPR